MKLFETLFNTIFSLFTTSGLLTGYAIFCTLILCVFFQLFILRKAAKKNDIKLSVPHFIGVYIFLIYIAFVYVLTGFGTIWDIIYYGDLTRLAVIHWIPFGTFEFAYASSNIVSYLLNIIMLMPFGFMLALIWPNFRSFKKIALTGFSFALTIELSQLFNLRATTADDLIVNTLGAIIGYFIFKGFYKLATKKCDKNSAPKSDSKILRNEAILFLICTVVGMFLFFNPLMKFGRSDFYGGAENKSSESSFLEIDSAGNQISGDDSAKTDNTGNKISGDDFAEVIYEYTNGRVIEIHKNSITIEMIKFVAPDGSETILDPGSTVDVAIQKNTTFEISKSNTTKDALAVGDIVDIYLKEVSATIAEKVVICRFD